MISPAYFSLLLNSTVWPSGSVYLSFFSLAFSKGLKLIAQYFYFMFLTNSNSALVVKLTPLFLNKFWRWAVTSLPAKSILSQLWAKEYPSYTGITWVTPSPESRTIPVDFPVAKLSSEWSTARGLPVQPRRLQVLGTSKKIFRPFSSYAWLGSCWPQWVRRGDRWVIF